MLALLRKIFCTQDENMSREETRYSALRERKPSHVHELMDLVKEINLLQKELYQLDRGNTCILSVYKHLLDGGPETMSKTRYISVEGSRTKMKVPRRTDYAEPVRGGYYAFKEGGGSRYKACVVMEPTSPCRYSEDVCTEHLLEKEHVATVLVFQRTGDVGRVVVWREIAKDELEPITSDWAYADVSILPELIIYQKDESVETDVKEGQGGRYDRSAATRW